MEQQENGHHQQMAINASGISELATAHPVLSIPLVFKNSALSESLPESLQGFNLETSTVPPDQLPWQIDIMD